MSGDDAHSLTFLYMADVVCNILKDSTSGFRWHDSVLQLAAAMYWTRPAAVNVLRGPGGNHLGSRSTEDATKCVPNARPSLEVACPYVCLASPVRFLFAYLSLQNASARTHSVRGVMYGVVYERRYTNLMFPSQSACNSAMKGLGVDAGFEFGISLAMIRAFFNTTVSKREAEGRSPATAAEPEIVRLGYDATDIMEEKSMVPRHHKAQGDVPAHTTYHFIGDHNSVEAFKSYPDITMGTKYGPDHRELQGEVSALLAGLRGQNGGGSSPDAYLESAKGFAESREQQVLAGAETFVTEGAVKKTKYMKDGRTILSSKQLKAISHTVYNEALLRSVHSSLLAFVRHFGDYSGMSGAAHAQRQPSLLREADDMVVAVSNACRTPATKFYSFHLATTRASDSTPVARLQVKGLSEQDQEQILLKVCDLVCELSKGTMVVKILSADGEGLFMRKYGPVHGPPTIWGVGRKVHDGVQQEITTWKAQDGGGNLTQSRQREYMISVIAERLPGAASFAKRSNLASGTAVAATHAAPVPASAVTAEQDNIIENLGFLAAMELDETSDSEDEDEDAARTAAAANAAAEEEEEEEEEAGVDNAPATDVEEVSS